MNPAYRTEDRPSRYCGRTVVGSLDDLRRQEARCRSASRGAGHDPGARLVVTHLVHPDRSFVKRARTYPSLRQIFD